MKILITASPWLGGSGTVGSELAKGLSVRHATYFLSFDFPVRGKEKEQNFMLYNLTPFSYSLFPHPLYSESLAERMIELVLRHGIQIIHAHYSLVFGTSAIMAKHALERRGISVKLVTTFHGTDAVGFDPSHMGKSPFNQLNRWILDTSDSITVPSQFMKRFLERQYGRRRRIAVVPNFVNGEVFRKTAGYAERDTLVHLSNFRPVKRSIEVLKAFIMLRKIFPRLKMVFIGSGPDQPQVKAFAVSRRIKRVLFLNTCSPEEINIQLNRALAVAIPSSFESFSLALLESASCGTPQIVTNTGGMPELIKQNRSGIIIPNTNHPAADIARAFKTIASQNTWEVMSNRGEIWARQYETSIVVKKYESLYHTLLKT